MKRVTQSARYVMDGLSPLRHVVTQLVEAGDRPLSLDELAFSYQHFVPGDFHRIKLHGMHDKRAGDHPVKRWFIEYAVSELGPDIIEVIGGDDGDPSYRLKVPLQEVIYQGRRVMPIVAAVPQFSGGSDPFSPVNGIFVDNLRDSSEADDPEELRASLREFGWLEQFPAIRDERGVVLVGHRRLKVAEELGIEPVVLDVQPGIGKAADAERLKLALASNVGFKPMTPTSRKRIATYLYGDVGWSMEKIGAALQVTTMTVSRDLEGSVLTSVKTDRVSKRGRIGEGRPRKIATADPNIIRQRPAGSAPLTATASKPEPAPQPEAEPDMPDEDEDDSPVFEAELDLIESFTREIAEEWHTTDDDGRAAFLRAFAALDASVARARQTIEAVAGPQQPRPQQQKQPQAASTAALQQQIAVLIQERDRLKDQITVLTERVSALTALLSVAPQPPRPGTAEPPARP